jgi:para-nitrobenzyl esterase
MNFRYIAAITIALSVPCFGQMTNPVKTETGLVRGVPGRDANITVFKGLPYAAPPVGNLRWKMPQRARAWQGVRIADKFGNGCAQNFPTAGFPKSEDCLYLNVWTPAKAGDATLPVMVWIHGGGLRVGSASEPIYDGEELARKGVVLVTFNYRLGVFGFFSHPELTKESPNHASGNYGFIDQLLALQWVSRNIAAFGGDPKQVTIFGQSAGGGSVNAQLASPRSEGLFRAAICESGAMGRTNLPTLKQAEEAGVKLAESVGAKSLAKLRAVPADKLVAATLTVSGAVIDGWFMPENMLARFEQGKQNKVPYLIGSNSDEGQHMVKSALPAKGFTEQANKNYGAAAAEFLKLFPASTDAAAKESTQRQFSDNAAAQTWHVASSVAKSKVPVYMYFFNYVDKGGYNAEPPSLGLILGADHGAELPYVFGLLNHWKAPVPEADRKLQDTMMKYWVNFARTMNPNGADLRGWKTFDGSGYDVMILGKGVGMGPHPRAAQVKFLDAHKMN